MPCISDTHTFTMEFMHKQTRTHKCFLLQVAQIWPATCGHAAPLCSELLRVVVVNVAAMNNENGDVDCPVVAKSRYVSENSLLPAKQHGLARLRSALCVLYIALVALLWTIYGERASLDPLGPARWNQVLQR